MTFVHRFTFSENHMQAVRDALGELPAKIFFDIQTAPAKRDMEEATDLILSISSGDIAVRIRKNKFLKFLDWSIRVRSNGHKTEIDKLKEGFARWYFIGWSSDDEHNLADWYLIDLDKVREHNILNHKYPIYDNYDGTAGMYIPIHTLLLNKCIVGKKI